MTDTTTKEVTSQDDNLPEAALSSSRSNNGSVRNNNSGGALLNAIHHAVVVGRHLKLIPQDTVETDGKMSSERFDYWQGSGIVFDWPGVRLSFRNVTGTSNIKIKMRGGLSMFGYTVVASDEDQQLQQQQQQDNEEEQILNTYGLWGIANSEKEYELASGLDQSRSYNVEIWKRDDPCRGYIKIVGLVVDEGGSADIVNSTTTTTTPNRRIVEFVGDEDTLGFLNMSETRTRLVSTVALTPLMALGTPKLRKATDVTKAWPALVTQELDQSSVEGVDYHIVAKALICAGRHKAEDPSMTEVYANGLYDEWRVQQSDDKDGKNLKVVDAVVVYIGQNDQGALGGRLMKDSEHLAKCFLALLTRIRQVRGDNIKIIVIVPTWDCVLSSIGSEKGRAFTASTQNDLWKDAVQQMGGEVKNFFIVENQHDPQIQVGGNEDFGLMLHWNASSHEKFAAGLADKLKPLLGFSWKDPASL